MILLNFSHPFTDEMMAQAEELSGQRITRVVNVPNEIDPGHPIAKQVEMLLDHVGDSLDWQTEPYVVSLPGLSVAAATILAGLHGRAGFFPSVVRVGPVKDSTPPRFEVAEIVDLQSIREAGRDRRSACQWRK